MFSSSSVSREEVSPYIHSSRLFRGSNITLFIQFKYLDVFYIVLFSPP